MNPERLLEHYHRIADAEDAVPRLRRFVLDLAVRGKLVEQDPADEPAAELLKRIAVRKARLAKEGKIKKQKLIAPVATEDIVFAAPPCWEWISLAEISVCLDYMRKPINGTERGKRIEGKSEDELYPYFGATQQQGWIDDYIFDEELLLLGEDGVPFSDPLRSKAYVVTGKTWVNNHAHVFKGILIPHTYLAHYLNVFDYSGRIVGATRSKLNQARAVDIPVALPPLAEQHRIVAKVDELMALCDQLETARSEREAIRDRLTAVSLARLTAPGTGREEFGAHARFAIGTLPALTARPGQIKALRQTILNLAVRGKLVEQNPADEPAAELLKRIKKRRQELASAQGVRKKKLVEPLADEDALNLSAGWAADAFANLIDPRATISYGVLVPGPDVDEGIHFVRAQDLMLADHSEKPSKTIAPEVEAKYARTRLSGGEILLCVVGSIGKLGIAPPHWAGANIARAVARISPVDLIDRNYLLVFLRSDHAQGYFEEATRTLAQPTLNVGLIEKLPVPLPPLAEQHRIVAKADELMSLCDQLETALTAADTTRACLRDSLLYEALAAGEER